MVKLLVGNQKEGWEINVDEQYLKLYHPFNLIDKLKRRSEPSKILFRDIKKISVGWNSIAMAKGENQHFIIFKMETLDDHSYDFFGTKNGVTKDIFKEAVLLLKNNHVNFDDPYNILDKVINTDRSIWDILHEADLQSRKNNKGQN